MKGRKTIPTEIKKQRGTLDVSRVNKNEPTVKPSIPLIPDYLTEKEKEAYQELAILCHDMNILAESDRIGLAALCSVFAQWREARDYIKENGLTYKQPTMTGFIHKAYPEVGIESDAWKRLKSMLCEFGLTPASRSNVSVIESRQGTSEKDMRISKLLG